MSKTDIVVIYCSSCRTRIPVEDLLAGKAVSVNQYCFCKKCLDKGIHQIRKISVSQERQKARAGG